MVDEHAELARVRGRLSASAAGRVALTLLAFGEDEVPGELTVSEIARRVGRERSQVSRMLKVLASAGLLEQNPETHGYRPGWQMYQLAGRAGGQRLLLAAQPALHDLVVRTKETALLSVLFGNRALIVAREHSPRAVQAGGWVGRTAPLHASASGRALVLSMSDDDVASLVQNTLVDTGLGPKAPTSVAALRTILGEERRRGYAVAIDELEDGLTSVAAPVANPISKAGTIASINVSGTTSRLAPHVDSIGPLLVATARRLTVRMRQPLTTD